MDLGGDLGLDFTQWLSQTTASNGTSQSTSTTTAVPKADPKMKIEIPSSSSNGMNGNNAPLSPPAGLLSPSNSSSLVGSGPIAPPPDLNNQPIPVPPEIAAASAASKAQFATTAAAIPAPASLSSQPLGFGSAGLSSSTSTLPTAAPTTVTSTPQMSITPQDLLKMTPQQLQQLLVRLPAQKQQQILNYRKALIQRAQQITAAAKAGNPGIPGASGASALVAGQLRAPGVSGNVTAGKVGSSMGQPTLGGAAAAAAGRAPGLAVQGRQPWQSDSDLPRRRLIISKIVQLLQQRKPDAPPEWVKKLPDMARRLEDSLYRTAGSLEEYSNFNTLKQRLQRLAMSMGAANRPGGTAPTAVARTSGVAGGNLGPVAVATPQPGVVAPAVSTAVTAGVINPALITKEQLARLTPQQRQALVAKVQQQQRANAAAAAAAAAAAGLGIPSATSAASSQPLGAQGKVFVNVNDINPTLQATKPAAVASVTGALGTTSGTTTATSSATTTSGQNALQGGGQNLTQQQQILRQQQQRLLVLRHASRCSLPEGSCTVAHCAPMKKLWSHITKCQDKACQVSHCVSSRFVLSHYQNCSNARCAVCAPVRQAIQRQRAAAMASGAAPGAAGAVPGAATNAAKPPGAAAAVAPTTGAATATIAATKPGVSNTQTAVTTAANAAARRASAASDASSKATAGSGATATAAQLKQQAMQNAMKASAAAAKAAAVTGQGRTASAAGAQGPNAKRQKTGAGGASKAIKGNAAKQAAAQAAAAAKAAAVAAAAAAAAKGSAGAAVKGVGTAAQKAAAAAALLTQPPSATFLAAKAEASRGPTYMKEGTSFCQSFTDDEIDVHLESLQKGFNAHANAAQLKTKLMPVLKKQMDHKYGWVFNHPVDPVSLGIPDYFDIIKNPMDLGTVKKRLETGYYKTQEQFAADVRLTFTNATTYNEEGSDVHTLARDMLADFDKDYGAVKAEMEAEEKKRREGANACRLCGGERFTFEPIVFFCNGTCAGRIRRNSYYYTNSENKYHWCQTCYQELKEESITVSDGSVVKRSELVKKKNDEVHEEPWVGCDGCNRWMHQICALFNGRNMESDNNTQYYCPICLKDKRKAEPAKYAIQPRPLGAKELQRTRLSDYLEVKIRQMLDRERKDEAARTGRPVADIETADNLVIRQVSFVEKPLVVREKMYERYKESHKYPAEFHYKSKCIVLFQQIDGVDVLLFGMYVHEFDHQAPEPNKRRVYISYLDSVQYFRPRHVRTLVYQELLVAYLEYVKRRGYHTAHIWACPPLKGDDYILYCHPEEQKTPKSERLRQWYVTLLLKSQKEGIVVEISNLYKEFFNEAKGVTALPYFEGDYWTGVAEEFIKSLEDEEKEEAEKGKKRGNKKASKKKGNKKGTRSTGTIESEDDKNKDPLMVKLGTVIEPMKDDFLVCKLYPDCQACLKPIIKGNRWKCTTCPATEHALNPATVEYNLCDTCYEASLSLPSKEQHPKGKDEVHALIPEPVNVPKEVVEEDEMVECEFFDTRQAFLSLCQGNHYQFDQLRRAKHSSIMVLYHLHNPTAPAYIHTCDNCKKDILTGNRHHCDVCADFDLCDDCQQKVKHQHELKAFPVTGTGKDDSAKADKARRERARSIQLHMQLLSHASACSGTSCPSANCTKMKQLLRHGATCTVRAAGGCHVCRRIWALLQIHARQCRAENCPVPRCRDLKEHLRRLARQQAAMEDRRRHAVTQHYAHQQQDGAAAGGGAGGASTGSAGVVPPPPHHGKGHKLKS